MNNNYGNIAEDTFMKVLSANLTGKRWGRLLKLLKFNLKCVNSGLKPSYLWDIGPALDFQIITKLICHLKSEKLLTKPTYVLCYENEVFVVNLESVVRFLNEFKTRFVDSSSKSEPNLVDSDVTSRLTSILRHKIETFLHQHESNLLPPHQSLHLEFNDDSDSIFPPSIYGLLLGYPVVYWNSSKIDTNNLSFVPLSVYELTIEEEEDVNVSESDSVYKFSVPISLNLDSFVRDWLKRLRESLNVNMNMSVENVVLPCVQL